MKKVRITAVRKACYLDLMEKYEKPISLLLETMDEDAEDEREIHKEP